MLLPCCRGLQTWWFVQVLHGLPYDQWQDYHWCVPNATDTWHLWINRRGLLQSEYWQVNIEEMSKEITVFIINNQLYQFKSMLYGLRNAAVTFWRLLKKVLTELSGKICFVFINICTWIYNIWMLSSRIFKIHWSSPSSRFSNHSRSTWTLVTWDGAILTLWKERR